MRLKFIITFWLSFGILSVNAQETVPTTGGEATGNGGSASYTVGQIVYTSLNATNNYSIIQGIQQPYEIFVVTAVEDAPIIDLNVKVYPNPAADFLTLKIDDKPGGQYAAFLYDMNGKLLKTITITESETQIEMQDLNASLYFLKIIKSNQELKVYKIIKK